MLFVNMKSCTKGERGPWVNVDEFVVHILRANVSASALIFAPIQQSKGASANRLSASYLAL